MQDLHSQFSIEYHFATYPRTPPRHAVALSPRESVSRNFQSPMAPYKFRSLATPKGGARRYGACICVTMVPSSFRAEVQAGMIP